MIVAFCEKGKLYIGFMFIAVCMPKEKTENKTCLVYTYAVVVIGNKISNILNTELTKKGKENVSGK